MRPLTGESAGNIGWPPEIDSFGRTISINDLEMLTNLDIQGNVRPELATGWTVGSDNKSITFNLRKGVKFHDGTDFNAQAAKYNLDAYVAAVTAAAAGFTSVDVIDDYTIRLNMPQYKNTLLGGNFTLGFVSPTAAQKNGIAWARLNPVGTGPFQFVSRQQNVVTKFKRFPQYWQTGLPYLDEVHDTMVADPITALIAFRSGALDAIQATGQRASELQAQGFKFTSMPDPSNAILIPDSNNPNSPMADLKVRQAIQYAIDVQSIVKAIGFGFMLPAYQLDPGHLAGLPNVQPRSYDPAKAKQLLADAGYAKGFKTNIAVQPSAINRDCALAIQANLAAVGIQATLEFPDIGKYTDYRMKGWSGFILDSWVSFPSFAKSLEWYLGGSRYPVTKMPDGFRDQYNQILAAPAVDNAKVATIRQLLFDNATILPVWCDVSATFLQPYVNDYNAYTLGDPLSWTSALAWLDKGAPTK